MRAVPQPAVAGILAVLMLTGCGVSGVSGQGSQNQPSQRQRALAAFDSCLQRTGFHNVGPPPGQTPTGLYQYPNAADEAMRADPAYATAYGRCATESGLDQVQRQAPKPSADQVRRLNAWVQKTAQCLRDRGWTIADSARDSNGVLSPPMPPPNLPPDQFQQFVQDTMKCGAAAGPGGPVRVGVPVPPSGS